MQACIINSTMYNKKTIWMFKIEADNEYKRCLPNGEYKFIN